MRTDLEDDGEWIDVTDMFSQYRVELNEVTGKYRHQRRDTPFRNLWLDGRPAKS